MVIKLFLLLSPAAEYIGLSWRWVWSTVVRQQSEVYDTHRQTKLTAPDTISRSRGWLPPKFKRFTRPNRAHSDMVCHPWLALATVNPSTKCELKSPSPLTTKIWSYERGHKMSKWWFGVVRVVKFTGNSTNRYNTYEFLLAFHCNYVSILHRFWDIARYCSKIAFLNFKLSHLYLVP